MLSKKKFLNILSFCDFEGEKKKNKLRVYKTYKGYNFYIDNIEKIIKMASRYYRGMIKKNEKLFSFEMEFVKNTAVYIDECKTLKKKLKIFSGTEFFCGVPLSVIKTVEDIHSNIDYNKDTIEYKVARLIVIASFYYVSLNFSGRLISKNNERINYRITSDNNLKKIEKLQIKKFYKLTDNYEFSKNKYLFNGQCRKNCLHAGETDFIADDEGNFCYYKNGRLVCGFAKFNFIKPLNFKIQKVTFTDKFCIYQNEKNRIVKICLDLNGNIILIVSYEKREKIYQVKILKDSLKFVPKTEFLHSCLAFENSSKIVPYRLSCLLFNNNKFDMGIRGNCLNAAFKGALRALKYAQLFKNVKIITLTMKNAKDFEALKILKYVKLFNKFSCGYYVIVLSNDFIKDADECFMLNELSDKQILFLKRSSVLFFDGKKYKFNLNKVNKTDEENFTKVTPFFNIKSTRLKELCDILYSVKLKTDDTIFKFTVLNICEMSRANYLCNRHNILRLFKMQTLDGCLPTNSKNGFVNFDGNMGTLSALYYLYSFINKYNDKNILKEPLRYSVFLQNNFQLETGKISDTLEYHMLIAVQYLINENCDNREIDLFKLFILKKMTSLIDDIKVKNKVFSYIAKLTNTIESEILNKEPCLQAFFNLITLKVDNKPKSGLSKIFSLFDSNNFKDFETSILSLNHIDSEEEKFLSTFLLKQYLTENILGIKFNKNLVSFNPNLPRELDMLEIEMCSSKFIIGFFGFLGIEVNSRKYYNYNYISLDTKNDNNVISVG